MAPHGRAAARDRIAPDDAMRSLEPSQPMPLAVPGHRGGRGCRENTQDDAPRHSSPPRPHECALAARQRARHGAWACVILLLAAPRADATHSLVRHPIASTQPPPARAARARTVSPRRTHHAPPPDSQHVNFTSETLKVAVGEWVSNETAATAEFGHIAEWDTSRVTDMDRLFHLQESFNADLNAWNTSSVTTFNFMFSGTDDFNGNVAAWATGSVDVMNYMFSNALSFDGDISAWDVSSVGSFTNMFYEPTIALGACRKHSIQAFFSTNPNWGYQLN